MLNTGQDSSTKATLQFHTSTMISNVKLLQSILSPKSNPGVAKHTWIQTSQLSTWLEPTGSKDLMRLPMPSTIE